MVRPERGLLRLLAKLGIKSAQERLRVLSILRRVADPAASSDAVSINYIRKSMGLGDVS